MLTILSISSSSAGGIGGVVTNPYTSASLEKIFFVKAVRMLSRPPLRFVHALVIIHMGSLGMTAVMAAAAQATKKPFLE
jgi:hypothetical protein